MAEKVRVHTLAKKLNVSSKTIIEKCHAEGIDVVKNHMSTLSAGLQATVLEWFSEGEHAVAVETSERVDLKKVRIAPKRKKKATKKVEEDAKETSPAIEPSTDPLATGAATETAGEPSEGAVVAVSMEASTTEGATLGDQSQPIDDPPSLPHEAEPDAPSPAKEEDVPAEGDRAAALAPNPVVPAGPQHVPKPAKLQGPRVVRYEAPEKNLPPIRRSIQRTSPSTTTRTAPTPSPTGPSPPPSSPAKTPGDRGDAAKRRTRVNPRRVTGRLNEAGDKMREWRDRDLAERKERLAGATGRRMVRRRSAQSHGDQHVGPTGPKTHAMVHEPIRMKEFCSESGLNFMQLVRLLRDEHGIMANINMVLPTETAELLALHFGLELEVVPTKTLLDDVKEEFAAREGKDLQPRPPIVTVLGHVDHGKTSLLDAIRKTQVVTGEDGGITQHISSYHVQSSRGAVTFVDTPGHEAFTEMRARGASVTDVVVLVIAADDGIMPQTIEAIQHAKAAEAPIVVALNKIDLGDQNKIKIFGQLSEHGLAPAGEWGGEIDVLETSATTGQGVTELVEHLADLSSLLELKSDPALPARGTVLEAETKTGVGPVAQILVQDGTLKVGAFVVAGHTAGKVRALVNDRGQRVPFAGPSSPIEVWGLDGVPAAGDLLFQVESLQRAKSIAEETSRVRVEGGRQRSQKVHTLQEMLTKQTAGDLPELNIIIKADVDGSVTALRQALSDIPSDEVKLNIRHAAVGAVNDSDVLLAATSHGIVVAYRVEPTVGAKRLARQHRVDVRGYRVIYNVCDDIKKALEGLLAPEENVESRGTAEVREVFRLSRKGGVVAGSFVTNGAFDRKNLVKITRDGVVVREGARLSSLRRFKEDVKEVRSGFECGIKIEGFDDIHAGDIIEAYEIVKTARTL